MCRSRRRTRRSGRGPAGIWPSGGGTPHRAGRPGCSGGHPLHPLYLRCYPERTERLAPNCLGPDSGLVLVHQRSLLRECAGLGLATHTGLRSGREPLRGVWRRCEPRAPGVVGSARAVGLPPHQPRAAPDASGVPVHPVSSGHPLRLRRDHRPRRTSVGAPVRSEPLDPGRRRGAHRRCCQSVAVPIRDGLVPGPELPHRRRDHPTAANHTRTPAHPGRH